MGITRTFITLKKMKIFSILFVSLVSAQFGGREEAEQAREDQECMDRCGNKVDKCHEDCNNTGQGDSCHGYCYDTMCRCFRGCNCPECCGFHDNGQIDSSIENDKENVSQFLKKRTYFEN